MQEFKKPEWELISLSALDVIATSTPDLGPNESGIVTPGSEDSGSSKLYMMKLDK